MQAFDQAVVPGSGQQGSRGLTPDDRMSLSAIVVALGLIVAVALVLLATPLGVIMVALPFRQLLLKFLLYQLHKTIGITAFAFALSQLALHWRRGRPAWAEALPDWQRRAASAVHATLFGLLCATPILGYLTAATAPARIPTLFLQVAVVLLFSA